MFIGIGKFVENRNAYSRETRSRLNFSKGFTAKL